MPKLLQLLIDCPHYNDSNGFSWNSLRKYIENKCYYLCLLCFTLPWGPIVKGQTEKTNRTDIKLLGVQKTSTSERQPAKFKIEGMFKKIKNRMKLKQKKVIYNF